MSNRISKVLSSLEKEGLDALLVAKPTNLRYLCGYTGSNGLLLITPKEKVFITDFRYKDQVQQEIPRNGISNFKIIIGERDIFTELPKINSLKRKNLRLGFEGNNVTYQMYQKLRALLPQVLLVSTENLVEKIAAKKEKVEIQKIKKAVKITDTVFHNILDMLKPGVKENEIAVELEYQLKKEGAEGIAFEPIVASGVRSAMPHGRASEKKIKKNEFVTLDFGAIVDGYVSDLTRTVVVGKANSRQKQIYNIVGSAQKKGITSLKSGKPCKEVDQIVRNYIREKCFGPNFGHGTGHGIGLQVHELPTLNSRSSDTLEENMVVTVEPGIYISGWGGVRIEDDVLVTNNGPLVLNSAPKELIEI
ncbi:MAG TPA: Xaa-Pro peptidase family protein [candidate division Zixibacteria bacterium]|nr:Xaa-Pro peptidase family protein [candidate division Zixibacteria bacterium]